MRIEYKLTQNELTGFAKAITHQRHRIGTSLIKIALASLLTLFIVDIVIQKWSTWKQWAMSLPTSAFLIVSHLILLVAIVSVYTWLSRRRARRFYSRVLTTTHDKVTLSYDQHGIDYQCGEQYSFLPWHSLNAIIHVSHKHIYLLNTPVNNDNMGGSSVIIPKRAFCSERTYAELIKMIERNAIETKYIP